MNNFLIALLLIAIFLIFVSMFKSRKVIYIKDLIFPILCTLLLLFLVIYSDVAVKSALKGINLWLNIVFPSLFPFFVGSELLNKTGLIRVIGVLLEPKMRPLFNIPGCGSFAFAMGITSGYPIGAKITAGLREEKLITKTEAERMLAFTNNSGPLFIMGAVAVGMYNLPSLGLFLFICHILACITVGFIFRFYKSKERNFSRAGKVNLLKKFKQEMIRNKNQNKLNIGAIFGEAVRNSVNTMLAIGGFIIFFSVAINLLIETGIIAGIASFLQSFLGPLGVNINIINAAVSGLFEITTGVNMASTAANSSFIQQLTVTSFIIGWAGLSVHSQVISIVSHTDISIKPYLLGKLIQGVFAGIYTFIGVKLYGHSFLGIKPTFSSSNVSIPLDWSYYLFSSCKYFFIFMAVTGVFVSVSFVTSYVLGRQHR